MTDHVVGVGYAVAGRKSDSATARAGLAGFLPCVVVCLVFHITNPALATEPLFETSFSKGTWNPTEWTIVKSSRWPHVGKWVQEVNCVHPPIDHRCPVCRWMGDGGCNRFHCCDRMPNRMGTVPNRSRNNKKTTVPHLSVDRLPGRF